MQPQPDPRHGTGYTANASAISLEGASEAAAASEISSSTGGHLVRAVEPAHGEAAASQRDPAIVAATAFYLVSKGMRILFHL